MKHNGKHLPDFMIIGAMKCATSTLHDQIANLPGVVMSDPKEPNFFSDDEQYQRGMDWYTDLFEGPEEYLRGESSTHYAKFPTYPETITRMLDAGLGGAKLVYVIRRPIPRLVSHFIHEWSQGVISTDINSAISKYPELIDYSRYYYQLTHYMKHFSSEQIMIVFYEDLITKKQSELERICKFIGYKGEAVWTEDMAPSNVSSQRVKKFPLYSQLIDSPIMAALRRSLIPKSVRNFVRGQLVMKKRPVLSQESIDKISTVFHDDLTKLQEFIALDVESYLKP